MNGEPKVVEYNVRLGDPETEILLPRLKNDFVELILACFDNSLNEKEEKPLKLDRLKNVKSFKGWWVYGEGQHLFKDESTLEEWSLEFLDEDEEITPTEVYLDICKMEYFPLECIMKGSLKDQKLIAIDYEILYIQGCGE